MFPKGKIDIFIRLLRLDSHICDKKFILCDKCKKYYKHTSEIAKWKNVTPRG